MVDFILSFISVSNILELPWIVKGPGFAILALLAYRALRSLLSLKPFKLISSLVMLFIVAFVLSRFGNAIVLLIENPSEQEQTLLLQILISFS
ncbi:MAG: hypothetical protein L3J32_12010 [Rhizobiaceae bacterium]|nr:hypothetical protein [Rhizobiaceae bacterium]